MLQKYGLFSVCGSGAQIKNLVMDNCAVTGTHTDGGILIGTLVMSTSVHNTSVIADVVFQDCDMNVSVASGDLRAAFGIGYSTTSADVEFRHVSIVRSDLLSASGNTSVDWSEPVTRTAPFGLLIVRWTIVLYPQAATTSVDWSETSTRTAPF